MGIFATSHEMVLGVLNFKFTFQVQEGREGVLLTSGFWVLVEGPGSGVEGLRRNGTGNTREGKQGYIILGS